MSKGLASLKHELQKLCWALHFCVGHSRESKCLLCSFCQSTHPDRKLLENSRLPATMLYL